MCTGTNSRALAALPLAALLLLANPAFSQTLKLVSLTLPGDVTAGSWVTYEVRVESKNRPPRRFMQRLAVVSREGSGVESGAWVELRTLDAGKTRIERGFFVRPAALGKPAAPGGASRLAMARYQRLLPDGTLYEYPVGEEGAPMADEDISAMDLFEFRGKATTDSLRPDTLRIARMVLPCGVTRVRRYGREDWQGDDTSYVNRAVMTRTAWENARVPLTGYARAIVEVSAERVPRRPTSLPDSATYLAVADTMAASADSAGGAAPTTPEPTGVSSFYRAEVILVDLGHDAVPEITQLAEPAPHEAALKPRKIIR